VARGSCWEEMEGVQEGSEGEGVQVDEKEDVAGTAPEMEEEVAKGARVADMGPVDFVE